MKISFESLHDLSAQAARLTAIVNLLRDPETRESLDPSRTDIDVRVALATFERIWTDSRNESLANQ